jgi:hypothetical protein
MWIAWLGGYAQASKIPHLRTSWVVKREKSNAMAQGHILTVTLVCLMATSIGVSMPISGSNR